MPEDLEQPRNGEESFIATNIGRDDEDKDGSPEGEGNRKEKEKDTIEIKRELDELSSSNSKFKELADKFETQGNPPDKVLEMLRAQIEA